MNTRNLRAALLLAVCLLPLPARAGSGTIDFGTDRVNFTMNLRFPASAAQLTLLQSRVTDMSHLIWDATEGQLRVGTVTFTCNETTLDVADYWVFANPIRSNSPVGTNLGVVGTDSGTLGAHINMAFDREGQVFFHELGHLALDLGDEYPEKQTSCGGKGPCFDPGTADEQNHCIMQQNVSRSEFCVAANHDPIRGSNPGCLVNPPDAGGAPCAENCQHWHVANGKYEASSQHKRHGESCWETLRDTFPQLTMPAGLPAVAEPAGWTAPNFVVDCAATTSFVLVLDESGSMAQSVAADAGEVCGNGLDDDGDGSVDESADCAQSRMEFVKAAGRAMLELAEDLDVRAGIVGFDSDAEEAAPIQTIAGNLTVLKGAVDGLSPGSQTAIGSALNLAKSLIDADPAAVDGKAAIVITDGKNNQGPSPESAAAAYVADGIRLYAIATGQASNDDTISDITANAMGEALNEENGDQLVTAIGELFAQYSSGGIVFPQTPYALAAGGRRQLELKSRVGLPLGGGKVAAAQSLPGVNLLTFQVEEGTTRVAALLGGNLGEMAGFGVEGQLIAPGGAIFDSAAPPPGLKVVFDRFFTLIRLQNPAPGEWKLAIRARPGAAPVQTGTLVVLSDNPRMHFFADFDRGVVRSPADKVTLTAEASFVSGLRDVAMTMTVRAPDGSSFGVPLTAEDPDSPSVYRASLDNLPMRGRYQATIDFRTLAATTNDPGENHPDSPPLPPLTVPIPPIQRSLTRTFFVDYGPWICAAERDCDGDGLRGEPTTVDVDGNGIPAAYDPDDDGDDRPDGGPGGNGSGGSGSGGTGGDGDGPFGGFGGKDSRRWYWGGAVGSTHPLGRLDDLADANVYAKLDAARPLTSNLALRLALGLAQLTAEPAAGIGHPTFEHLSANLQWHTPFGAASRFYLQAGPGAYRGEGSTQAGWNAGLGWLIPASQGNLLELGLDYHAPGHDRFGNFVTWHLGILFH